MQNDLTGTYFLASDITLPKPDEGGLPPEGFRPIGYDTDNTQAYFQGTSFTGSFDGNGYTIRNLTIQRPDEWYGGLFGLIEGASVQNVCLENVNVLGGRYVGGIVGYNDGGAVSGAVVGGVDNSVVTNNGPHTGGLVGYNESGTVTGFVDMKVVGDDRRVNDISADGTTDSYNGGAIGGLVGRNADSGVVKGHASGEVTYNQSGGHAFWVGGLVGLSSGDTTVIGYSSNTVTGSRYVGGLVGFSDPQRENQGSSAVLIGYSTGKVLSRDPDPTPYGDTLSTTVGGLAGWSRGTVLGYSTAAVVSMGPYSNYVGGLTGQMQRVERNNKMEGYFRGTLNEQPYEKTLNGLEAGWTSARYTDYPRLFYEAPFNDTNPRARQVPVNGVSSARQVTTQTTQTDFTGLSFGSAVGEWSFVSGQWPRINLGSAMVGSRDIFADLSQPTEPKVFPTPPAGEVAIRSWQDLQAVRDNLRGRYRLEADITFPAPGSDGFPASGFQPLGGNDTPFVGRFDGNGHTISNLSILRPNDSYVGLFGHVLGAEILNVRLENVNIEGFNEVGSIVGYSDGSTVSGSVTGGPQDSIVQGHHRRTGGLVGTNANGGSVTGFVDMKVLGNREFTGGLVGSNQDADSTVKGYALGEVDYDRSSLGWFIGGLAGANQLGSVIGYSSNKVTGVDIVGGMVGSNGGRVIGYSTSSVERVQGADVVGNLGGLVGSNTSYRDNPGDDGSSNISAYFTGTVKIQTPSVRIGGLIGQNAANFTFFGGMAQGYFKGSFDLQGGIAHNIIAGYTGYNTGNRSSNEANIRAFHSAGLSAGSGSNGFDGTTLTVDASTQQSAFTDFTFGTDVGEWSFAAGQWPRINLGSAMVGATDIFDGLSQPTAP